jgi:hypothetical protein
MINIIRKFLFKCEKCGLILSAEFENNDDIKKIQENKMDFECHCGGICKVLFD